MAGSGGRFHSLRWKTLAGKGVHLFQGEERGTTATAASSTKALGDLVGKIPMVYSWVWATKFTAKLEWRWANTKMSGNPLKYTGIILNFDLWFGMVRVSNLSWRTWSILSNWTSERSLWNPCLSLYSDVFIYTCIYICIDCSGDSLYANINLPDSQIRMCFPGFKLGLNFSVDLLFWLNGMRLCESPTPQTFTPLLQLKSEDLNFHKKTG